MRSKILVFIVIGMITATASFGQKDNDWTVLGSKKVNWTIDTDVLVVGPYEGVFSKLKIEVKGGTVHMIRMVVTYGNGAKEEIPLRHVFKRGSVSRIIDLKGGDRIIKSITFVYDRKNIARQARVWVYGK